MKVIIPNTIDIISSSLSENEYPKWVSTTTYADTNRVIYNHYIYESVGESNTGKQPDMYSYGEKAVWLRVGATNYWAAFDDVIESQSVAQKDIDELVFELRFDYATAVGLLNLKAEWVRVTATDDGDDAPYWDSGQVSLIKDVDNEWDYEFLPIRYIKDIWMTDVVMTEMTVSISGKVRIVIHKTGGGAAIGHIVLGLTRYPGATLYGAEVSSKSYSRVEEDEFGNTFVAKRRVVKVFNGTISVRNENFDQTVDLLNEVDAVPTLYVGDDRDSTKGGCQSFTVYGLQKGYRQVAEDCGKNRLTLTVQGLV